MADTRRSAPAAGDSLMTTERHAGSHSRDGGSGFSAHPLPLALAALLATVFLAGCAADGARKVLHFGMDDVPESRRLMWPPPPEVPRYLFAGQLTGEANFRDDKPKAEGVAGFLRWIAGIIAGEKEPVVLQRPAAVATDGEGRIYVTDMSRQAVFVFDPKAGELHVWDKADGLANFVAPAGITVGPDGLVLVADSRLGIVARLDAQGNPRASFGRGVLKRPTGIAYDPRGQRIYVADTGAHDVKLFDADGKLVKVIGQHGEGPGQFNFPTHLAFAQDQLYVTDAMNSRVQVFSGDGSEVKLNFGARGLYIGNFVRPKGVAVDRAGNIYVVESYYDHLLVFNRHGEFLMGIGGLGQQIGKFYLPSGVWVDRGDRILVADMFNGRVMMFQFLGGGADGEP